MAKVVVESKISGQLILLAALNNSSLSLASPSPSLSMIRVARRVQRDILYPNAKEA